MALSDTQVILIFVLAGVTVWSLAREMTESAVVQVAVLIGVGVIAPTLINYLRADTTDG